MSAGKYTHFTVTTPSPFVTHVEINRPEKLNAFTELMCQEYHQIFTTLSNTPTTRAIILSGAGSKAFSTGLDLTTSPLTSTTTSTPTDPSRKAHSIRHYLTTLQSAISSAETCTKPVICVLHGHVLGLAIDLATATDVRICSSDSRFAVSEVGLGLAADAGTLSRLPKVVGGGMSWVKEVCLSGREFGAEEAARVGFVSFVEETKDLAMRRAVEIAERVARLSPVAVQGTKAVVNYSVGRRVEDGLEFVKVWNAAALQSADVAEALAARLGRREARFEKL